jgi:hypothetical protein
MIGQVEEQITGPAWNLETGELATPSPWGLFLALMAARL